VLLRKASAYVHVAIGFLSRIHEICEAELCGILQLIVILN
jgi:hypothetical protein